MNFLIQLWSVIAGSAISWLGAIDNDVLAKISNLLTILVIIIGLIDWSTRKQRQKIANKKQQRNTLEKIERTQKPFKVVHMLNEPMSQGEKIGVILENTSKIIGVTKMKKFFKWVWYNKEQLLSIIYNVAIIVITNFLMWTDLLNGFFTSVVGTENVLVIKIVALCLSVLLAALTVRNICVKYGLSSLDTIDAVLAERAEAKAQELTPEQKQIYKGYISTLNSTIADVKKELQQVEAEFTKLSVLYNADNSLVADYESKTTAYQKKIAAGKEKLASLEGKVANFKALLTGQTTSK